jgi:hypothetical protein
VETEAALPCKPLWRETPKEAEEAWSSGAGEEARGPAEPPKLKGFELVGGTPPEPKEVDGIERGGKERKNVARQHRVVLDLPPDASAERRYGVLLRPLWRETGKSLRGYEAILVASDAKAHGSLGGEEDEDEGAPESDG